MNKLELRFSNDPIIKEILFRSECSSCTLEGVEYNEAVYGTPSRPQYSLKLKKRFNSLFHSYLENIGLRFKACYIIQGSLWVDLDYNPHGAP